MDHFDRERYITVYGTLAEVLERERQADSQENHLSFILGGLARRIFVDAGYLPPDELLEETAQVLRSRAPRRSGVGAAGAGAHGAGRITGSS